MSSRLVQSALLSLVMLGPSAAVTQTEIIVREKPLKSQTLSGTVELGDSPEGVKGVLVEWCGTDWKIVKASTRTDSNGHFSFPNASKKELHYLRLSFPGAHSLLIKVKITCCGPKELRLHLDFST